VRAKFDGLGSVPGGGFERAEDRRDSARRAPGTSEQTSTSRDHSAREEASTSNEEGAEEMKFDEYVSEVMRTQPANHNSGAEAWSKWDAHKELSVYALGLTGESGEVADLIKKHVGHGHDLDGTKILLELGDVLWYVAALANVVGWSLEEVAEANVQKLRKRYPDGFSPEASKARAYVAATREQHSKTLQSAKLLRNKAKVAAPALVPPLPVGKQEHEYQKRKRAFRMAPQLTTKGC
jgi:NTP pyrophosphatase (non-canonical NTP hydrolase)